MVEGLHQDGIRVELAQWLGAESGSGETAWTQLLQWLWSQGSGLRAAEEKALGLGPKVPG